MHLTDPNRLLKTFPAGLIEESDRDDNPACVSTVILLHYSTAVKPAAVQKNTVKPAAIEIKERVY